MKRVGMGCLDSNAWAQDLLRWESEGDFGLGALERVS